MKKNPKKEKMVGSVLVSGAGIAGMQAALDLAESGFKVYLQESSPAIGGRMVQLDKTFPTGDCAMCTIAPRLVECGRHRNIEIITCSQVEEVMGEEGNFTVKLKHSSRYVDEEKCNACGDCEKVCPVNTANEFDHGLSERKAINKAYPQAVPNIYVIDKQGASPCRVACPAGVNAHGYIALIRNKKYREALDLIHESMPFPSSCGRICNHPCESECRRGEVDEPVAICSLKRFVADMDPDDSVKKQVKTKKRSARPVRSIAVIGSGPTGLSCAYYLAGKGYKVVVYESKAVPGGMIRTAIPDFRLPKEVVDREVDFIRKSGVEIKTNTTIGKDISFADLQKEFSAVFIAVGAVKQRKLRVAGEDLEGVYYGVDFLEDIKSDKNVEIGGKVRIIGGGNTAIDAAMTALRLGAGDVGIIYRRSREEMPASPEEIALAEEEGIKIEFLVAPVGFTGEAGKLTSMKCIKMELGEPDESGRRRPVPVKGSETTCAVDTVIIAAGQYQDAGFLPKELKDEKGNMLLDRGTLQTPVRGIYAGGDAIRGADLFVNAVADGRRGAISIDRFLQGEKLTPVSLSPENKTEREIPNNVQKRDRIQSVKSPVKERIGSFNSIDTTLNEEQASLEAQRCLDCGVCSECMECVKVCMPNAIDHNETERLIELKVGSIIISPGFETFDARLKGEYGYGNYRDVITSIEYERILSASGPYGGEIRRPSDGKKPERIAFIQCVGSRDKTVHREYCSSVCCMYTAKEAIVTREHLPGTEVTVFYNDIRAFGKGYERYWKRARDEYGVTYTRCISSKVSRHPETGKLLIKHFSNNRINEDEYDLVVLATGIQPSAGAVELAKRLDVKLSSYGFCSTPGFSPQATSRPGIYVSGAFHKPEDIPESVMQASGSASEAMELLSSARNTLTVNKKYPAQKDVSGEKEKIGVFVCHCGRNIASVVDVEAVAKSVRGMQGVVHSETCIFACSPDGLERIKEEVKEKGLNRVVVASCSPRTHEGLFRENIRNAGLNPYLFEMANIRDQCSWVHFAEPAKATQKAKGLVHMAVAKSRYLEPLKLQAVPVIQKALVIGGGLSGMVTALSLAGQGYEVFLVEKERELGGNLRRIYHTLEGDDIQELLKKLIGRVNEDKRIKAIMEAEIKEVSGFVGNFKTLLTFVTEGQIKNIEIEHGTIIVATGGEEYVPDEYLHGRDRNVITQRGLEGILSADESPVPNKQQSTVVMIQCVGSRNDEHPYCSRVCCSEAIKNALKLKKIDPEISIYILYRDIRTYGMKELFYQEALEAGITFVRYDENKKPELDKTEDSKFKIRVEDQSLMKEVTIDADLVVLSAGIVPHSSAEGLPSLLKVPLNEDGFFMEAHVKLRPVDFPNEGIFLCGLAHSPKFIDENISQAKAAAARAASVLSKTHLDVGGVVAVVQDDKCAACLTCVRICPYNVPVINSDGVAVIEIAECQGCGTCAGECPAKAIQLQQFKDEQIIPAIGQAVSKNE